MLVLWSNTFSTAGRKYCSHTCISNWENGGCLRSKRPRKEGKGKRRKFIRDATGQDSSGSGPNRDRKLRVRVECRVGFAKIYGK